jgi:hypothetical protein
VRLLQRPKLHRRGQPATTLSLTSWPRITLVRRPKSQTALILMGCFLNPVYCAVNGEHRLAAARKGLRTRSPISATESGRYASSQLIAQRATFAVGSCVCYFISCVLGGTGRFFGCAKKNLRDRGNKTLMSGL